MSKLLKVAVIGVDRLGIWRVFRPTGSTRGPVAAGDRNPHNADSFACKRGVVACAAYREFISLARGIGRVMPNRRHYKIARRFLEAGIRYRVEKCSRAAVDCGGCGAR